MNTTTATAGPTRFGYLLITDANGKPVGASILISIDPCGWANDEDLSAAEAIIQRYAKLYADAAQGPDSFPLSGSLSDRGGYATLLEINSDGTTEDNLSDGLNRCDRCGEIHNEDDGQTVNTRAPNGWGFDHEQWCKSCVDNHAIQCDDCHNYYESGETHTEQSGDTICSQCMESNYYTCSDCGEVCYHETHNTVDDSDSVCSRCIERGDYYYHEGEGWSTEPPDDDDDNEPQGGEGMHRYDYGTDANEALRHRIPDTGHTYGAEMEYKGRPDNWAAIAKACQDRAILTNDSTVTGELVSAALSAGQLRCWLANSAAALSGTRNDSTTGLHFHVDRRALTPYQWFTLSHYAATHADTLETIAGRSSNEWSDLQSLPANHWPTFARRWISRSWPNRYAGMNLRKGPTIEWRICRATKTPQRALARFGMIQRLTALGRLAPSQRPQTAEELKGWLARDQNIAAVTGWEPGTFNYRAALMQPIAQGDQQPQPPSLREIEAMEARIRSLNNDLHLTARLRRNAETQEREGYNENLGPVWVNDAKARAAHYHAEERILWDQVEEARTKLREAEALHALT